MSRPKWRATFRWILVLSVAAGANYAYGQAAASDASGRHSTRLRPRWLRDFCSRTGPMNLPTYFARGFQIQASAKLKPQTFQAYVGVSKIFGPNGDPWDSRIGTDWYPWKNRAVWWNNEMLRLSKSPGGYNSVPFAFGGKGWVTTRMLS